MKIFNVTGSLASLGNGLIPSECYTYKDLTPTSSSYTNEYVHSSILITSNAELLSGFPPNIRVDIDSDYYNSNYAVRLRYSKGSTVNDDYSNSYHDGSCRYHYIDPSYVTMHSYSKTNSSYPLQVGTVLPKNILLIRCHQTSALYSSVNYEGSIYMPLLSDTDSGNTLSIAFNGTNHVVTSMWDYSLSITIWCLNI